MKNPRTIIITLVIFLGISLLCNLILGFIALDRTIRVNELVG